MANVERLFMEINNVLYEFDGNSSTGCPGCMLMAPRGGCVGAFGKSTKIAKYCCKVRVYMQIGFDRMWSWKKISA
jgi:hypothetical protein